MKLLQDNRFPVKEEGNILQIEYCLNKIKSFYQFLEK